MPISTANISQDEIKVELDFSDEMSGLSASKRSELKDLIQAIVEDNLFNDISRGISPVDGSRFKGLSKEYKKAKVAMGGEGKPNLELEGNMLSSLTTRFARNKLILEISKDKETPKAYNHLIGDTLPQRQFLPIEDGQLFRKGIMSQIKQAIDEVSSGKS